MIDGSRCLRCGGRHTYVAHISDHGCFHCSTITRGWICWDCKWRFRTGCPHVDEQSRRLADTERALAACAEYCAAVRDGTAYRVVEPDPGDGMRPGEATRKQIGDVRAMLADWPIATWMIFKAGWDAARAGESGEGGS